MPAPTPGTAVAYAVISVVPLIILAWYAYMYSNLGSGGLTGGGLGG